MEGVKAQELNEAYQIAQNKIVREGQAMMLSQAAIMNRLKQLQEELKKEITASIIPIKKTNSPEMIIPEEKHSPSTTGQYIEALKTNRPRVKDIVNRKNVVREIAKGAVNRDIKQIGKVKDVIEDMLKGVEISYPWVKTFEEQPQSDELSKLHEWFKANPDQWTKFTVGGKLAKLSGRNSRERNNSRPQWVNEFTLPKHIMETAPGGFDKNMMPISRKQSTIDAADRRQISSEKTQAQKNVERAMRARNLGQNNKGRKRK